MMFLLGEFFCYSAIGVQLYGTHPYHFLLAKNVCFLFCFFAWTSVYLIGNVSLIIHLLGIAKFTFWAIFILS